ncbi:MAG: hypothetical protein MUE96_05795 [Bacteroidia bacterium]|nr:hypothetical protein [Bacteroidia bacterium]
MLKIYSEQLIYLAAAFVFTLFLGYIDEGYYNFNFLTSIGNILVLSVYMIVLWGCEVGIGNLLSLTRLSRSLRISISILVGLFLPIIIILWAVK